MKVSDRKEIGEMYQVEVDSEKCIGCGECVDICPEDVFELEEEISVPVRAEDCVGCESCVEVCEEDAISVTES
jgi:NAD-dependent dihydropyrimidine dehydrogenase PreA subunit